MVAMRKVTIIFAIGTLILLSQTVITTANPFIPSIHIKSPEFFRQKIYQTTTLPIEIIVDPKGPYPQNVDIYYCIDDGLSMQLNVTSTETPSVAYFGKGTANVTDGYHTLRAYSSNSRGIEVSTSVTFLVNTSLRYPLLLLSPTNTTYKREVPLTYINDEKSNYQVYYSLDDSSFNHLTNNITLTELSNGPHVMKFKSSTEIGLFSDQIANFEVISMEDGAPLSNYLLPVLITFIIIAVTTGSIITLLKYRSGLGKILAPNEKR